MFLAILRFFSTNWSEQSVVARLIRFSAVFIFWWCGWFDKKLSMRFVAVGFWYQSSWIEPFSPLISTTSRYGIFPSFHQVTDTVDIALKSNHCYKQIKSVTKDQPPLTDQTNLIYNIPCTACELSYVGQTSQYLKKRIDQHKICTRRTAVFIHKEERGHTLDFDKVEVLQREPHKRKREFLEMLHINNKNTINIKTDITGINSTYKPILKKLKQLKYVWKSPWKDPTL